MPKQGCRQEVLEKTEEGPMSAEELPPGPHLKAREGVAPPRSRESATSRVKDLTSSPEVGTSVPHLGTWRPVGDRRGRGMGLI